MYAGLARAVLDEADRGRAATDVERFAGGIRAASKDEIGGRLVRRAAFQCASAGALLTGRRRSSGRCRWRRTRLPGRRVESPGARRSRRSTASADGAGPVRRRGRGSGRRASGRGSPPGSRAPPAPNPARSSVPHGRGRARRGALGPSRPRASGAGPERSAFRPPRAPPAGRAGEPRLRRRRHRRRRLDRMRPGGGARAARRDRSP